jgi:hypothetical protein
MMRIYLIAAAGMIFFSSCLKRSIPDAMLDEASGGKRNVTATLNYKLNGHAVGITVKDAYDQSLSDFELVCTKYRGYYNLDALCNTGETTFSFYTDSLKVGNYKYTGGNGPIFFTDYNGSDEFVFSPPDSMSFNITSYRNGRISGNFSGVLTPMRYTGGSLDLDGVVGSVLITNGSFKNVPVFY